MYLLTLIIVLACSSDIDVLMDSVLKDQEVAVEEQPSSDAEEEDETPDGTSESESQEEDPNDGFESRITEFPPIEDVYVQSGKGYDQTIIRLDENNRTSYLKFDLEPIDDREGYITEVTLQFTVDSDEGSGTIDVYKGLGSDWTEQEIDNKNAPEIDILLGSLTKEFKIGNTEEVVLSGSDVVAESTSLILEHKNGNDFAMASKEHPTKKGPKLRVKYRVPKGANPIIIEEEDPAPPTEDEPSGGDESPEDETPQEDTPEENEAPMAVADASPSGGQVPLEVSFTGGNSSDDNSIVSYSWDFKDGSTASTANPTHTFTAVGTYEVELSVTDDEGLKGTDTVTITVTEESNAAPVAKISASPLTGEVPLEVDFTGGNSTDDNAIKSYHWNFKDGGTATNANPTHTFATAGSYNVELTVTDEHGLTDKETVTITVNERSNEAPVAKASANPTSGTQPLEVSFNGGSSTDDQGVISYSWNFKDGSSSNSSNPTHTFNDPGTYVVELTVTDEDGLTDKDTVTITVNAPQNTAPNAVATADRLSGDAPLEVNFSAANSSDDNEITSYYWEFPGNSSTSQNATHTFNNPGVYTVTLTVTDGSGLTDTDALTITVNEAPPVNPGVCTTDGGLAGDTGLKTWCWEDISIPNYSNSKGVSFSNGQLKVDSECYENQVSIAGDQIKFQINPTNPTVESWCSRNFNMRAEFRTAPWNVQHSLGTEEWFGWSYTFGNDYVIDQNNQWKFFQVHNGIVGESPLIGLEVINKDQFSGHAAGEIYVTNAATSQNYNPTGITPTAGQTIDVVVHVIWGNATNGLLQVWINGSKVYDKQVSTVLSGYPWGGNAKWGIYKWPWNNANRVQQSLDQGITNMTTYMGALRMITRRPGDANYGQNSYSQVAPK